MFKSIVFILAVFAVAHGYITPDSEELHHQVALKIFREEVRARVAFENVRSKLETVCPGYGHKLENVSMEITECVASVDEDNQTICAIVKNNFEQCVKPAVELFNECLPERARRIPAMLVKMVQASFKYLCKTDGEHLLELRNPCILTPSIKFKRCIRKVETTRQKYVRSNRYPSAEEMCDLLQELKPCLTSHVQTSCGHSITREFFIDFMNQGVLSVCENHDMNEIELTEPHVV